MLSPDPNKRPDIFELQKHPYLKKIVHKKDNLNIGDKLKSLINRRKLKATQYAVYYLSMMKKKKEFIDTK